MRRHLIEALRLGGETDGGGLIDAGGGTTMRFSVTVVAGRISVLSVCNHALKCPLVCFIREAGGQTSHLWPG